MQLKSALHIYCTISDALICVVDPQKESRCITKTSQMNTWRLNVETSPESRHAMGIGGCSD